MKSRILYGLLLLILVEVFLGGGGRLIDAGPVSIRMLLYALAMAATVWMLYTNQRLSREIIILLSIFSAMLVFGTLIGVLNGANRAFIFEDVKPLLFFYLLPFFYLTLQSFQRLSLVAKVVKISAVVLAGSYVLIFGLIHLNVVPFLDFYQLTLDTGEFYYRGEIAFFYKGFLYLCVGFIFYYFIPDKAGWLIYLIAMAIILTFTRGFLFALSATFLLYYLVVEQDFHKNWKKVLGFGMVAIYSVFFASQVFIKISEGILWMDPDYLTKLSADYGPMRNELGEQITPIQLLGDRMHSDNIRKKQFHQVLERVNFESALVGHGFGIGVPIRPVHMEVAYLEIFHKQGLVGIAFWVFIFVWIGFKYIRVRNHRESALATVFTMGSCFVFVQSITNQYLNNPIGMTMILLAIVALIVFSENGD